MRKLSLAVFFFSLIASARAAMLPSDSSTLEALRSVSVSANADRFFDGMSARVATVAPVTYAPLPPVSAPREEDKTFTKTTQFAPNLTVHSAPEAKPFAEPARRGVPRAVSGTIAGVGAGLIVAGLLIGGPAAAPLAAAGALMLLIGAVLFLTSRK